jgi:hypothetical protein
MQTRAFETKITPAVSDYTWDLKAERKDECFWIREEGRNCLNYKICETASRYNLIILMHF